MALFEDLSGVICNHSSWCVISHLLTLPNWTPTPAALEDSNKSPLAATVSFQGPIIAVHKSREQNFPGFGRKSPCFKSRHVFKSNFYHLGAVWPWKSCSPSLRCSFLHFNQGKIMWWGLEIMFLAHRRSSLITRAIIISVRSASLRPLVILMVKNTRCTTVSLSL